MKEYPDFEEEGGDKEKEKEMNVKEKVHQVLSKHKVQVYSVPKETTD